MEEGQDRYYSSICATCFSKCMETSLEEHTPNVVLYLALEQEQDWRRGGEVEYCLKFFNSDGIFM